MTDEEMILRLKKIRKNYSGKDDEALTWAMECIRFKRPHGEWKLHSPYEAWLAEYKCSNCDAYGWFNWHFCPSCGAKMRKEGGEE